MKLQRLILLILSSLVIYSCGEKCGLSTDEPVYYSETGVWESGEYFISFSSDKFLTAYVADGFIDCGPYARSEDDVVSCKNPYFEKTTTYKIAEISGKTMRVEVSYVDVLGNSNTTSLDLVKSDKEPTEKGHKLAGASYTYFGSLGGVRGNFSWEFLTYYSGLRTSDTKNLAPYPIRFFYIYLGDMIYVQRFTPVGMQTPTIGGWTNDVNNGVVQIWSVEFNSAGMICGLTKIN